MKYGHVQNTKGGIRLTASSTELSSKLPKPIATIAVELTEEIRDEIKPEAVWARSRFHINLA